MPAIGHDERLRVRTLLHLDQVLVREEIGVFLQKVSDKANEPLLPKAAFHS